MRVSTHLYATEKLLQAMDDAVYNRITNVATLPGITEYALCMPEAILAESGNHYLEIQVVRRDDIFGAELASPFYSPGGQDYSP